MPRTTTARPQVDSGFAVENIDWTPQYSALREAVVCPHGAGYMIHESARWSDAHAKWLFFPRKMSRQPYDEVIDEAKCCNLMLACGDDFDAKAVIAKPASGGRAGTNVGRRGGEATCLALVCPTDDPCLCRGVDATEPHQSGVAATPRRRRERFAGRFVSLVCDPRTNHVMVASTRRCLI